MNMNMKEFAVGESDFKKIITGNYYYVDKTLFIKEVIDRGDLILLLPRPRRFGKTLNISMLKYFYDCCPGTIPPSPRNKQPGSPGSRNINQNLFNSLAIENAGEKYREKMGQYPVIFLTFKDVKVPNWNACLYKIKQLIQDEYLKHDYLLDGKVLKSEEAKYFKRISNWKGISGIMRTAWGNYLYS